MIEHLLAAGLEARPDGKFVTPIAKDIPGRRSMVLDPKKMGFCRLECIPTEDLATCPAFVQVTKFSEMASRIQ